MCEMNGLSAHELEADIEKAARWHTGRGKAEAPEGLVPEAVDELLDCLQPGEIAYVWQIPSHGSPPDSDETKWLTLPQPLVMPIERELAHYERQLTVLQEAAKDCTPQAQ